MKTVFVGLVFVSILLGAWWFSAAKAPDRAAAGPAEVPPAPGPAELPHEVYSLPERAVAPRAPEAPNREPVVDTPSATRATRLGAGQAQVPADARGRLLEAIQLNLKGAAVSAGTYEFVLRDTEVTVALRAPKPADGLSTGYHSGGGKSSEGWIRDGKRVGPWAEWHANGKRKSEGEYYYGEQHGFWTTWYPDGQRESAGEYLYGKHEGHWTTWYEDGGRQTQTEYRNGKHENSASTWHLSGELASEGVWGDGKQHGRWSTHHPTGKLESRGEYRYGQRDGAWVFYDEEGNLDPDLSVTYELGVRLDP